MFVRRLRVSDLLAVGAIVLTIAWIGLYCVQLRDIFYLQYGPFWDGVSYDDQLAAVMLSVRAGDPIMAIALIYRSTAALPWLEGMLLAPFVAPSRAVAVWMQISWIAVTALVAYYYFRRVARYHPGNAACCALLFFAVHCTFYWNGGVVDFRLDYLQYTLFGLSCLAYLIAQADGRLDFWVLWGVALGLASLGRATTPVFAGLVFGPFFLIDLWLGRRAIGAVLLRYGFGGAAYALLCGWYFVTNFSRLYFYYVVWNWNAIARLPLSVSAQFVTLVYENIGPVAVLACLVLFGLNLACALFGREQGRWNLRALWCGLAPLAWLVGSGARPYGAVCEIAIFGIVLFLVAPMTQPARHVAGGGRAFVAVVALAAALLVGMRDGRHGAADDTGQYTALRIAPPRASVTQVTRCLSDDLAARPSGARRYAVLYTGLLNSEVVTNALMFDAHWPAEVLPDGELSFQIGAASLAMSSFRIDRVVTPVQWGMVDGADDSQRVDSVAREHATTSDYIIAPGAGSDTLPNGTINNYATAIADRIAAQVVLRPLCRDIAIGPGEFATVYRNMSVRPQAETATPR